MRRRSFLGLLGLAATAPGLLAKALERAEPEPFIAYSTTNGKTWSVRDFDGCYREAYRSIAWDGSQFVAAGERVAVSSDGITWTSKGA